MEITYSAPDNQKELPTSMPHRRHQVKMHIPHPHRSQPEQSPPHQHLHALTCRPKPTDPPKEASAVPPLKLNWACMRKRQNAIGFESVESAALLVITTQSASITFQNTLISKPYVNVSVNDLHQLDLNGCCRSAAKPLDACYKKRMGQKHRILPRCDPNNTNDPKSDSPVRSRPQTARTARPENSETGMMNAKRRKRQGKRESERSVRPSGAMEEKNKKNKATGTTNPMSNQDVQGSPFEKNEYTKSAGQSESQ